MSEPVHFNCFLCEVERQHGPEIYEGRNVPDWKTWICNDCRLSNIDGIVPDTPQGEKLIAYIEARGVAYKLNTRGRIFIPG